MEQSQQWDHQSLLQIQAAKKLPNIQAAKKLANIQAAKELANRKNLTIWK